MRFDRVHAAIAAMRAGKMVILVDDEDRENEGDLCMAAACVTAEAVNFMATHGRGLICLPLTAERLAALDVPMMVADNTSRFHTAFTVSIEARHGVTTGISAADRARTIQVAVDPNSRPQDLARPGHVFPLRAQPGGVLVRAGQTEGSVDLARLAGHAPAGIICEIMNDDGTMARRDDLRRFAARHGLGTVSIAELIEYRLAHETLVHPLTSRELIHPHYGRATLHVFATALDSRQHLAWVKGDVTGASPPPLVRVQAQVAPHEVVAELTCGRAGPHAATIEQLAREPRAAWICLQQSMHPASLADHLNELRPYGPSALRAVDAGGGEPDGTLRQLGIGAQILRALGLTKIRLVAGQTRKLVGLEAYGLHVDEVVAPAGGEGPDLAQPPAPGAWNPVHREPGALGREENSP